jgi:hypothetical protein
VVPLAVERKDCPSVKRDEQIIEYETPLDRVEFADIKFKHE